VICESPLEWECGYGKTPHLHHDHDTGGPIGFAHVQCNMEELRGIVIRLRRALRKAQKQLSVVEKTQIVEDNSDTLQIGAC
jgi:hypothetical protein